jgi:hypothetical protein
MAPIDEPGDYWSNDTGWGCLEAATVFAALDLTTLRLPRGGIWVPLKPYSVLLLYPDYLDDTGYETFYAFVEAVGPIEAVHLARRKAVAAQTIDIDDPTDFHPLLVIEGHHYGQPVFNT